MNKEANPRPAATLFDGRFSTDLITRRTLLAGAAGIAGAARSGFASARVASDLDLLVERYFDSLTFRQRIAQLFIFQAQGTDMTGWFQSQLDSSHPGGVIFV